ncbi:MAG: M1 family aminopeptidase, partial [Bacteroidota bacterium]
MTRTIYLYEIRFWLRNPLTYFICFAFFSFAFILMLGSGGYFDAPKLLDESVVFLNAPFEISFISLFFTKLLLFILPIFVGNSIYRDINSKVFSLLYSYPIKKSQYLFAKFCSAFTLIIFSCLIVLLGILFGEVLLGSKNPNIGPFQFSGYLLGFLIYMLPTLFIVSILVFCTVGFSRNRYAGFVVVILALLIQTIVSNAFPSSLYYFSLLDPLGQNAFQVATKDWDIATKNTSTLPFDSLVLKNRLFWLAMATALGSIFFQYFKLSQFPLFYSQFSFKKSNKFSESKPDKKAFTSIIQKDFSLSGSLKKFLFLARFHFNFLLKNWLFLSLCLFGLIAIVFISLKATSMGRLTVLPSTALMLYGPLGIYSLVIIVATFLFSGILFFRDKNNQFNSIIDSSPVSNFQLIGSKVLAIAGMQILMMALFIICSMGIQVYNGYIHFELGLYVFHLFLILFPSLFIWNITSFFVYSLIPNLYAGLFLLLMLAFGAGEIEQLGLESWVFKFNQTPELVYNDFYAYNNQLPAFYLVILYWLSAAGMMLSIGFLVFQRGKINALSQRVKTNFSSSSKLFVPLSLFCLISFLGLGVTILLEEQKVDKRYQHYSKKAFDTFTSQWERYAQMTPPQVRSIDFNLDLYPNENRFTAEATYHLFNPTNEPLDTILIRTGYDEETQILWEQTAQLLKKDTAMNYYLYKLQKPIAPGDSIDINFMIQNKPQLLFDAGNNVYKNGSFLRQDILPRFTYQFENDLVHPDDTVASKSHYFGGDANYVKLRTQISTTSDQLAIAPGELISEVQNGKRTIYTYENQAPVKFNFSFHSGKYQLKTETHKGHSLQCYYLKNHEPNVDQMLSGLKGSLDYNRKQFGTYPHKSIRIVEFPELTQSYTATIMANNIPTSERVFKISNSDQNALYLPYYVIAHELTHEWNGSQIMPAKALGAKMLTESLTEYISLQIYKSNFGADIANRFLKLQHERYRNGQKRERKKEQALAFVETEQEYIAYGKGTLVLNSLAQMVGENKIQQIIRKYYNSYKYEQKSFPTSIDFLEILKANIDSSYHKKIAEDFESTICYDYQLVSLEKKANDIVELVIEFNKQDCVTKETIRIKKNYLD